MILIRVGIELTHVRAGRREFISSNTGSEDTKVKTKESGHPPPSFLRLVIGNRAEDRPMYQQPAG